VLLQCQSPDLVVDIIDMDQNGAVQPRNGRVKFGEANDFHRVAAETRHENEAVTFVRCRTIHECEDVPVD
jgi:hypothetical protein